MEEIVFSSHTITLGVVTFRITNTDNDFHFFEINGVDSRVMGPRGGKAVVHVKFKRPGLYHASCPDDVSGRINGVLRVTA
jgi:hypothetical protein